jgi:ribitol 2-dehydrogenase
MVGMMDGKVAVVTGAASGIGRATAEALLAAGAQVVFVDRDEKAVTRISSGHGKSALPLVVDLLDAADCASMIPRALERVPHIDILHCTAGTSIGGDLVDTTGEAIDRMSNLNVNAVMKNVHGVVPHMKERGTGDIVVTCSIAGHAAIPWEPVYSSSKWAITCFVQTMRRQLFRHGIRVSQVSPGPVVSALLADWPEENLRKAKESGSHIEPTEVAEAVMFMLSRRRNVTIRDMLVLPTNFDI